jgi:hypothetical protein
MPFSYNEWVKKSLIPMLKKSGINATLAEDGAIIAEMNGRTQITPYEKAYTKYEEYLAKYKE